MAESLGTAPASPSPSPSPPVVTKAAEPLRPIPPALRPLRYVGIPDGVLRYRPKPPSCNTSIFLVVTTTLVSLWYYDRRECKRIRQQYIDAVKPLAEQPLASYQYPRKVHIYGAKSPGDDDCNRSIVFFTRYIKPVLVAAAVDFEILNGVTHGGLCREIRERIYARRRQLAGLEQWGIDPSSSGAAPPSPESPEVMGAQLLLTLPFSLKPEQQLQSELDGATVIIGRPAYKEYMEGLKQGWTTPLPPQRQDLDELLSRELAEDSKFDEVTYKKELESRNIGAADPDSTTSTSTTSTARDDDDDIERQNRALASSVDDDDDDAGAPIPMGPQGARLGGTPFGLAGSQKRGFKTGSGATSPPPPEVDPAILAPLSKIPAQPPIVFANFVNLAGWRMIPHRILRFFNHRKQVSYGGQVALAIVQGDKSTAREFDAPLNASSDDVPPQGGDLDWGLGAEDFYPPHFYKLPRAIAKQREAFYSELARKLKDTRALVCGLREPTKAEKNDPPASESELKTERLHREKIWRVAEMGFNILRPDRGVAWSEAFRSSLRVLPVDAQGPPQAAADVAGKGS